MDTVKSEDVVESTLYSGNLELSKIFEADVVILAAQMAFGLDDIVRSEIEKIKESNSESDPTVNKLVVFLETTGGYIEVVERIVEVFRRHYSEVEFVIPNFAYSAGTVLALSGDEIYMDYYSVLGPIDPQFETETGDIVPGMGYVSKYNSLMKKINSVNSDEIDSVKAEMAFLLKKFDPAKIFNIEQAIKHSQELVEQWLPAYKFKNWNKTRTRELEVSEGYKKERAQKIAAILGDAEHWHSHGRGISMRELDSEKIGLKVVDFGADPKLNTNIRHYYGLFSDYLQTTGIKAALHSKRRLRRIG